jgi:Domain of unknown function (DUF5680)
MEPPMDALEAFIVEAKTACYVGGGTARKSSCRTASHDITFARDHFGYLDSYFGGSDFIGQEVVWENDHPVWAMNYYGHILEPTMINAATAGSIIQQSLSQMYQQNRFLGGFSHTTPQGLYTDESEGDYRGFSGTERIIINGVEAYRMLYHGGLIHD